jgi:hypothetical protein
LHPRNNESRHQSRLRRSRSHSPQARRNRSRHGVQTAAFIELINAPMPYQRKATPAEYPVGLKRAIEKGWLLQENGTLVRIPTERHGSVRLIGPRGRQIDR